MFGKKKRSRLQALTEKYAYCSNCGTPMAWYEYEAEYDARTGLRRVYRRWACPANREHYVQVYIQVLVPPDGDAVFMWAEEEPPDPNPPPIDRP